MAQLIYEIQGTSVGLAKAVNESISLLQNLQLEVNKLSNGAGFTGLGSAIQVANNQALQLNKTLSDTSLSAQDKGGIAALDTLGRKLLTIKGNTELFGDSLRNQQAELGAYQSALNKLLSLGFQPLDGDVTRLKTNIDSLTTSIKAQESINIKQPKITDPFAGFQKTGSLITDAESKVKNLGNALKNATDTRGIVQYNIRLQAAQEELNKLKNLGISAGNATKSIADTKATSALSSLSDKLKSINGNVLLFGSSLQTNQQTLKAFQTALNQLLAAGVDPLDKRVTALKSNIDGFTKTVNEQKGAAKSGGIFSGLGSQLAGVVAGYTSVFAVIGGVKHIIDVNAEISDSLADVRRTAGLTAVEVNVLADQLKKIDTRTSLKGLLDIAVIGGQLGIAKDQLGGFTKAVDQLSVTLGSELKGGPEEIAQSLGILDKVFAISAKNGGDVEKAFNKIGSVILGLGQSGLATGDFLADFAKRVGGVAAQARLSLPVLLSYGAVLQEQGVSAEVAGTAFKKLVSSLATKRSDFFAVAQLADSNLTLKEFTRIINTDTQQALTLFFNGLQKGGATTTQFQDLLKSVGLDAARSGQAITALALHQQDLTKHIAESNKQFQDGALASEQFRIKNDTLGASIQKLTNAFDNLFQSENKVSKFFKTLSDGITNAINHLAGLDKFKGGIAVPVTAVLLSTGSKNRNTANDINDENTKILKQETALPDNFTGKSVEDLRALIPKFQNLALEARNNYLKFANAIKNGQVNDPKNGLHDFAQTAIELNNRYKDLIATFNEANKGQKNTLADIKELTDAELTSIPQIRARIKELTSLPDSGILGSETNLRIIALNDRLKALRGTVSGLHSSFLDLNKTIDDLLAKTNNLAQASGLTGYALSVEKITATYIDLNRQVDQFNKKVAQDVRTGRITQAQGAHLLAKSANVTSVLPGNEDKELNDAKIAEAQRVTTEIDRINNEFGVKAEQTRGREIAQVEALADKEIDVATKGVFTRTQIEQNYQNAIAKAKGNDRLIQQAELLRTAEINAAQNASDEVVAIQNGKITAIRAINDKYLQIEQDLWDKISIIDTQAQADVQGITESATAKIVKEWETRREAANKYYAQLKVLAASDLSGLNGLAGFNVNGLVQNAITQKQGQTNTNITNAENVDVNRELLKPFTEGITQATRGIVQFFSTFNQQTDQSFTALFSGVVSKIEGVFNTIFENLLDKQLSNALINGITASGDAAQKSLTGALQKGTAAGTKNLSTQLSSGLTTALAAAGLLGSTISGLTPKTSVVGQGLGGALSGAASGALIGSAIPGIGTVAGAIIGGGIGLLGGIFGASKAQKELQAQQLAEQKQQTALLKASLAYTSTIIGRMTSQGVVTGVDVGAFGQLTATVSGKDLQFVLDRNNNGR